AILSGSSVQNLKDGEVKLKDSPLVRNTVLFVLGISTTFFILGSSVRVLNHFITANRELLSTIGGILIIIMGLFYLGYLNLPFLQKEKKFNLEVKEMKPLTAYLLGFTFSFGWSPCIGPMLASALIMASSSESVLIGNLMILVYTLGFTLPFIIIAIFYDKLFKYIDKIKLHMKTIQKVGGALLLVTGLVMALGGTDNIIGYFSQFKKEPTEYSQDEIDKRDKAEKSDEDEHRREEQYSSGEEEEETETSEEVQLPDFTLVDQYGETHTLSDYKGKVVFLNFWATWCPPCRMEMPDIEEVYKDNNNNSEDVIILGVAAPDVGREGSKEDIIGFLEGEGYTYPVVFDFEAEIMEKYAIQALPSTFIIDKEGNMSQYVPGAMDKGTMENLINNAK
ncbi:MAG TPA: cytochrome c biogenesis protein/redoxin, partial [Tissierellales bacterium]|nr:cytochrome c biogenesis protein/redoxin [Tissierellales bacterium]